MIRTPPPKVKRETTPSILVEQASPPVQLSPSIPASAPVVQLESSLNAASTFASISAISRAPSPGAALLPNPKDAQISVLNRQIRALIEERDAIREATQLDRDTRTRELEELRTLYIKEKRDWEDVCDSLQDMHSFEFLREIGDRYAERIQSFTNNELSLHQEKISSLARDHKISQFQNKEFWLKHEMDELQKDYEFEMEVLRKDYELEIERLRLRLHGFEDQNSTAISELEDKLASSEGARRLAEREKTKAEAHLQEAQEDKKELSKKYEDVVAKLDRAELKFRSTLKDLSERNDEIKKLNKLDKRDERELGELRDAKVNLDIKVKELEKRLKEEIDAAKAQSKEYKEEIAAQKKELAAWAKEIAKYKALKKKVDEGTGSPRGAKAKKASTSKQVIDLEEDDEDEEDLVREPTPPPKARPKPTAAKKILSSKKRQRESDRSNSDVHVQNDVEDESVASQSEPEPDIPKPRPRPRQKASASQGRASGSTKKSTSKSTRPEVRDVDSGSEEMIPPAESKAKRRSKELSNTDDEEELVGKKKAGTTRHRQQPAKVDVKGKSRAISPVIVEDDDQEEAPPKSKLGKRKASDTSSRKISGGTVAPGNDSVESEAEPKKKRKRLLGGVQASTVVSTFDWAGSNDGGIGIPSILSPMVPQRVPPRSFSGRGPGR